MRGVPFPKKTEFRSLGVGVRTTDRVAPGPLILKRIGKACALQDRIHGVQGDFDNRCKVVATMVNATGLHMKLWPSAKKTSGLSKHGSSKPSGEAQTRQSEGNNLFPHVSGTQNCPLPAGTLRPRRLAGKALQNTWPSHDHGTSRVGREPPNTQVGTFWSVAENSA